VPLDPSYPADRVAHILDDSRPVALLTSAALAAVPRPAGLAVVELEAEVEADVGPAGASPTAWAELPTTDLSDVDVAPRHLAYVIYTSGSTGKPKGVMNHHRGVVNLLASLARTLETRPGDALLAVTTISFDIAALELWMPLGFGACVVLAGQDEAADPRALMRLLSAPSAPSASAPAVAVTQMQATPATWRMLLDAGWPGAPRLKALCGGEALPGELAARLAAKVASLWNVYGPTETTIWSTVAQLAGPGAPAAASSAPRAVAPIGAPVANTRVYVLDARRRLAPIGAIGELWIGGAGVARGYWHRPELTGERFCSALGADPSALPGARMYRTGDLCRWLPDGTLEYLGRNDFQVKVRGFRVETGEVEAALRGAPGVADAAVIAAGDGAGQQRLVGYVVPRADAAGAARPAAVRLGIFYFAEGGAGDADKYRLYVEGARRADELGLHAVWTPERHFTELASAYPNPSVLSAALAMVTSRIQLRSGSVVLPLHHPLRVAEEWSVVDNLSGGRVGLSFASGWVPGDFVFAPDAYADRHRVMLDGVDQVRRLWRGEALALRNGVGQEALVRSLPRPVQAELPVWLTAAQSPETFAAAGRLGANVLTGLLGQNLAELTANLQRYREARAAAGHDRGTVSLMLHTYVAATDEAALEAVRGPLSDYLRAHASLRLRILKEQGQEAPLDAEELERTIPVTLQRYVAQAALIGSPETCLRTLARLREAGVDEIACLIDFGLPTETVLDGLTPLAGLEALQVAQAARTVDAAAVREHLRQRLPEYMVPSLLVPLERLPLTPNGKVDRKALPAPSAEVAAASVVAPRTEEEARLAGFYAEILGVAVEHVGAGGDFFELGGHSLLAIRLLGLVNQAFGVELPLRALFEHPTVADLAACVASAARQLAEDATSRAAALVEPVLGAPRPAQLPLSFAQERLWFLDQLSPGGAEYNIPLAVRLAGALDVAALERALAQLVARHQILRTRYALAAEPGAADGAIQRPVQLVDPPPARPLALCDLRALPAAQREARASEQVAAHAAQPFDLARGPVLRALLVRIADDADEPARAVHLLSIVVHHIASDGWQLFLRELAALYAGESLPALPLQYADYAVWQRAWLAGPRLERQLAHWQAQLAGAPAAISLPTDRPRPPVQSFRGDSLSFTVPAELTRQLRQLAQAEGATLFMVLMAAYQAVLSRWSGQDDLVVGSPIAGRTRAETQGLIGFFANTLAYRGDLSGAPTFRELVRRVRDTALGAYAHQELPFERLVEALAPARDLSRHPIFQVMLDLQSAAAAESLRWPGLVASEHQQPAVAAKFDLTLSFLDGGDGQPLDGRLEYAADLFDAATVARFAEHLSIFLAGAAASPGLAVSRLPLLSAGERHRLLDEWAAPAVAAGALAAWPLDACVHRLFEAQVVRSPDALAVTFEDASLTYAELNARANQLARHLRSLGAGAVADSRVALCAPRGLELVVGLLAALKAGAAYVPLDPSYPVERLAHMLADSAPVALVTSARLPALPLPPGASVPVIDLDAPAWQHLPATDLPDDASAPVGPASLAYVIYTSGSTGQPKGVAVEHRNLVASTFARAGVYRHGQRFLLLSAVAFDSAVAGLFGSLLFGHQLVLMPAAGVLDPALIAEAIARHRITSLLHIPALVQLVWEHATAAQLASVRELIVAGEPCPPALLGKVARHTPAVAVFNEYGPTEGTVWATVHRCDPLVDGAATSVPIGRPIAGARVYLLDAHRQPVPTGVAGELYLGGLGVARGYLHQPALTAARFVDDPFATPAAAGAGARMYKTGDLARWRGDGTLEFLGRDDFQVKVRGFRIELGEIEARLVEHPALREAAVLVRRAGAAAEPRLVAYVTLAAEAAAAGAPAPAALRAHLAALLPDHMVPAAYVVLDALPLTAHGKLDRQALPAPGEDATASAAGEAPSGELEEQLAAIWGRLLGVTRVGRGDSFFSLGGHSLLAVQLRSRLREAFGVELRLTEIFAHQTLAALAGVVHAARASLNASPLASSPAISAVSRAGALPLSFAQQRMWFLSQMEGASAAYNISSGLRLRGPLDAAALERAFSQLVARHEALRTTFRAEHGQPRQVIALAERHGFELRRQELPRPVAADLERALQHLAAEEAGQPFDLERGPLLRARLVRIADEDHALLVTLHHIVSDGWSMGILWGELGALYAAETAGTPRPALPALPLQYADYAAWQRRWMSGEALHEQAAYWQRTLEGAPTLLELPADRPRPARQDHAGGFVPLALDAALTARLHALGRRHGATLFSTLLAGWAALLARFSGQRDLVIGVPVAGRGRGELEPIVGCFVNTLAVRLELASEGTLAELLAHTQERALAAQQHQELPFEQVVELVKPARSLSHSPLFQVMFAWQNTPGTGLALDGLAVEALRAGDERSTKLDLTLALHEHEGQVRGGLEYATALFERRTVERIAACFEVLLSSMGGEESVAARPALRLPLLPAAERAALLEDHSGALVGLSGFRPGSASALRCLPDLFEAQVVRAPDRVAVEQGGRQWTYAQLDLGANQLAHHLQALGAAPDRLVALCTERAPEMILGQLAAVKAGAGYLPLDPSLPDERLRAMLADARPVAVLAEGALAGRLSSLLAPSRSVPVLDLGAPAPSWRGLSVRKPDRSALTPSHLAYVIYTSGSTGTPKGVEVSHASAVYSTAARLAFYGDAAPRFLQLASYGFDISVAGVWWTLAAGGCLHHLPPTASSVFDAARVARAVRELAVTHLMCTASLYELILAAAAAAASADPGAEGLSSLRQVAVGGEPCSPELLRRHDLQQPATALTNEYGLTEAAVWSTAHRHQRGGAAPMPIGRPIPGSRVYLLDERGELAPLGATGELYLGGPGVARGYLNRPELTAQRFLRDPFSPASAASSTEPARLYRTGDLGRLRPDGSLELLGRNDEQVKLRGYRIELGELRARLASCPGVREAAVLLREDVPGDRRLVAYVTVDADAGTPTAAPALVDAEALRAHLAAQLPEHMVPSAFLFLDRLPLTASGKLDHRALPAPERGAARAHEAPQGELEWVIASVWTYVLKPGALSRHDNFFELGGHSLLTFAVASMLAQLGVAIEVTDLFAHPTVAALAAHVRARGQLPAADRALVIRAGASSAASSAAQAPLFLVHDGEGQLLYTPVLASQLPPSLPIYGLPALPADHSQPASLEEMAARLAAMVRAVQPAGPYRVAGWSFGGSLAHALAAQLLAEGEAVSFLALLDTHRAAGLDAGLDAALVEDPPAASGALEPAASGAADEAHLSAAGLARSRAYRRAELAYRALPLPIPVHFFKATGGDAPDPLRGWGAALPAGTTRVHLVGGTHQTMFEAHNLAALGRAFTLALASTVPDGAALYLASKAG
jgi:pristinamycin I synthase 3 and 4